MKSCEMLRLIEEWLVRVRHIDFQCFSLIFSSSCCSQYQPVKDLKVAFEVGVVSQEQRGMRGPTVDDQMWLTGPSKEVHCL